MTGGVLAVTGGDFHTLALRSNNCLHAWGYNVNGQLGDNSATNRLSPVSVSGPCTWDQPPSPPALSVKAFMPIVRKP
jgi:alpha-tubulin suppressor-like RCC1 family protein